jgi:hypothetical protein
LPSPDSRRERSSSTAFSKPSTNSSTLLVVRFS